MILFIDELHTIVGAGAAEGAVDAANLLKPMLARGELRASARPRSTSTASTSRRTPRSSAASSPCCVGEPTVEDTIAILRGLKERYEVHHGVRIQDSALVAAATLSDRYIADRFLPDKAIDLVDEAASRLRIEIDSHADRDRRGRPARHAARDRADRRSRKETDPASAAAARAIERELAEQRERSAAMKAQWQREKDAIERDLRRSRSSSRQARREARARRARGRPAARRRAALRDDPRAREALEHAELEEASRRADGESRSFLKEEVDADDVAEVVAQLDRHPGQPPARGRDREARPHGGAPARAGDRPGRGGRGRRERAAPLARRAAGPRPADRHVPVPRPDRRRQDRAGPRAGRVHVRHARTRWSASTCPSTWRSTPSRGWSARRPATSATTRAAS